MYRTGILKALAVALAIGAWATSSRAGDPPLPRYFYYPYQYFPHSYWPAQSPQYPEPKGSPYVRPPAYMAYPPFKEPGWRYELWSPQRYHRGNHFWLDQF